MARIPLLLTSSLASFLALGLLGCPSDGPSPSPVTGEGGAPAELNLFLYSEYIDPQILADFTKEHGTEVHVSLFESTEEMLAKLQHAAGTTQYDLVVAPNQAIAAMRRLNLIQPLDHAKLPHLGNLAPRFRDPAYDPNSTTSVAYQWGTVGLMHRQGLLPEGERPSWSLLFDPAQHPGTFVLLDEARDQLGVALKFLGHSVNATDPAALKKAGELLLEAKRAQKARGFEGGVGGKNRVAAGSVDMAVVWNGDAVRAMDEVGQDKVSFVIPKEGSIIWTDALVITSGAPNPDGAHALIDYLLRPEVGARLSAFTKYATPNQAALPHLPAADRENSAIYPSEEVLSTLEYLTDVGAHTRLYDEVWTAVKAR